MRVTLRPKKKVQFCFCPIDYRQNVYCCRSNFVIPSSCAPLRIIAVHLCRASSPILTLSIIHSRSTWVRSMACHRQNVTILLWNCVYVITHDIFFSLPFSFSSTFFLFFFPFISIGGDSCMHAQAHTQYLVLSDVHRWRFIVHNQIVISSHGSIEISSTS